ncbi:hypothetical protein COLO4_36658 [Corchorus olitorius]|uniref:Uncharacterized protein n=1 Tax=Corchorus olitorius TaxID=93759 RepID=A0A1R3G6Z9_9ROSI|nr:hypothetical protein COLO4_36658 [Corchorus olitorius]
MLTAITGSVSISLFGFDSLTSSQSSLVVEDKHYPSLSNRRLDSKKSEDKAAFDPLKEWVTGTVEASAISEEEISEEGLKEEEDSPLEIEIE